MMAMLDPSKLEDAVKVVTRLDEKTSGLSLKVIRPERSRVRFQLSPAALIWCQH